MKNHTITGGGGIQLHVVETGNPQGRPHPVHPWLFAVLACLEPANELGPGR